MNSFHKKTLNKSGCAAEYEVHILLIRPIQIKMKNSPPVLVEINI